MGIKGIYKEIGAGERVSLCKIATEHIEQNPGRPFRLAIDVSIWQFQIQAARGGSNPAIRTMFYRLSRMLGHGIDPIFVFDGPKKPEFKRNKRSGRGAGAQVSDAMAKRLIRHFGFLVHEAPGEAEAECALLQRKGIVDAVLSEDVDTIMFGCGKTFRSWSAEGSTSATPTHVTVYDADKIALGKSGLDREGMVLVALMSGGDYIPEGIPGCGVKVACEAARAGFGRDVCRLKKSDTDGLKRWREKLMGELQSNESRFFRTKHKALVVPPDFPNMEVLRYYTHPVVSNLDTLDRLDQELRKPRSINIAALREFVRETFDWDYKGGAIKLIRVIAPSMLVQRLVKRCDAPDLLRDDLDAKEVYESSIVKRITSRRSHASTDGTPELRVGFIPEKIVGLNLSLETEEPPTASGRSGLALNSDDDFEEEGQTKKTTAKKPFDPYEICLTWVPESIVEMGVPLLTEDFKGLQRQKEAAKGTRTKKAGKTAGPGPMDQFINKVIKNPPSSSAPVPVKKPIPAPKSLSRASSQNTSLKSLDEDKEVPVHLSFIKPIPKPSAPAAKRGKPPKKGSQPQPAVSSEITPWTLAKSPRNPKLSNISNPRALSNSPIIITSSPIAPTQTSSPPTSATPTKRSKAASDAWFSSGEDEPASPSPSPRAQACASQPVDKEPEGAPTQFQPPVRRARQFKRTKSDAEENSTCSEESEFFQPAQSYSQPKPSSQAAKLVQSKLQPVPCQPKLQTVSVQRTAKSAEPTRSSPLIVPLAGIKGFMGTTKRATTTSTKPPPNNPTKPLPNPVVILDTDVSDDDDLPDLFKNRTRTQHSLPLKSSSTPPKLPTTTSAPPATAAATAPQNRTSTLKSSTQPPPPKLPTSTQTSHPRAAAAAKNQTFRQTKFPASQPSMPPTPPPATSKHQTLLPPVDSDDNDDDIVYADDGDDNYADAGEISVFAGDDSSGIFSGGRLWKKGEIDTVDLTGDTDDEYDEGAAFAF